MEPLKCGVPRIPKSKKKNRGQQNGGPDERSYVHPVYTCFAPPRNPSQCSFFFYCFVAMQLLLCLLAFFVAGGIPVSWGFLAAPTCSPSPSSAVRYHSRSGTVALRAEEGGSAPPGSSDDVCPGYPRCSGEYRDKGCDGTGR